MLLEDFVSPKEETLLLAAVDWLSANEDDNVTGEVKLPVFLPIFAVFWLRCCVELT